MGKNSKINKTLTLSVFYALRKWVWNEKMRFIFVTSDVVGNFPIVSDQSEDREAKLHSSSLTWLL